MVKQEGNKLLNSSKNVDWELLYMDYVHSDDIYVADFLKKKFTPGVATSGVVLQKCIGRRQDKIDYREEYYKNYKISPEIKKKYTAVVNKFAKTHTEYMEALVEKFDASLERDENGKIKNPNSISFNEFLQLDAIIKPLYNKSNANEEDSKAIDFVTEVKKALERTASTRDNYNTKVGKNTG